MTAVEAQLKREDSGGSLVDWLLNADADNPVAGLSDPVIEYKLRALITELLTRVPDALGTWGYAAGVSGTETLTGSKRVRSVTAHATTAGSLTIAGGDSIPIPANVAFFLPLDALLTDAEFVFTGTDTYFIDFVTG